MKCKDCKWWQIDTGYCRKYAPKVFLTTSSGAGYDGEACVTTGETMTRWPRTNKNSWCGEFAEKEAV